MGVLVLLNPIPPTDNPYGNNIDLGISGDTFSYTWEFSISTALDELGGIDLIELYEVSPAYELNDGWTMTHDAPTTPGTVLEDGDSFSVTMTYDPGAFDPDAGPPQYGLKGYGSIFTIQLQIFRTPGEDGFDAITVSAGGFGGWFGSDYRVGAYDMPGSPEETDVPAVNINRDLSVLGFDVIYFEAEPGGGAYTNLILPAGTTSVSGVSAPFYYYEEASLIRFEPTDTASHQSTAYIHVGNAADHANYPQSAAYDTYTLVLRGNYVPSGGGLHRARRIGHPIGAGYSGAIVAR